MLLGVDVTSDSISIRLNTNIGPLIGVCDADCCSQTWIENIELPALGFPCTIVAADELEMPEGREALSDEPQEYIRFYGLRLKTNKGELVVDYRNASNGYYGGNLVWSADRFYGGVYNGQEPNQEWLPVETWLQRKTKSLSHELNKD